VRTYPLQLRKRPALAVDDVRLFRPDNGLS
jgi:hypothetical protein